jgi:MFS family permease
VTDSPESPFAHKNFRLWWVGAFLSLVGTQMSHAALSLQIYYELARGTPYEGRALGAIGLARAIPMIVVAFWGGSIADAVDRRRLMIFTQSSFLAITGILALAAWQKFASLPLLYGLIALQGALLAVDLPARQAMVPNLVPKSALHGALSWQGFSFNSSMVVGPAIGTALYAKFGAAPVYLIDCCSFTCLLLALGTIDYRRLTDAAPVKIGIAAALEGIRFVWKTPILWVTMILDFGATFLAGCNELMPIFVDKGLLQPEGLYPDDPKVLTGLLRGAPALGSALTAAWLARRAAPNRQGLTVLIGVVGFGLSTVAFGLTTSFTIGLLCLALSGAADAISFVVRNVIRQELTPDALRGRMSAVNMIFVVGGPLLGEFEAGMVNDFYGPRVSVIAGGVACVVIAALTAVLAPWLVRQVRNAPAEVVPPK